MSAIRSSSPYPVCGPGVNPHLPKNKKPPSKLSNDSSAAFEKAVSPAAERFDHKAFFENRAKNEIEWRSIQLIKEASAFFEQGAPWAPVSCHLQQKEFPLILKEIFETPGISGICIGERHSHLTPKKLLIENMALLKALGVTTLYLENLKSDLVQQELDDWFHKPFAELPEATTQALAALDAKYRLSYPYSFTNLVIQAKNADIRIIAIDSSESAIAGSGEPRLTAANYIAKQTIDQNQKMKGGNFVVLTGVDHGSTQRTSTKIPGISELVQCPFLIVSNESDRFPASVVPNPQDPYQLGYLNKPGTVHAVIFMDQSSSSPRRNTL